MRYRFLFILCLNWLILPAKPSVVSSLCTFDDPAGKPYVELYLGTDAASVKAIQNSNGKYQAAIQVLLIVRKDNEIVFSDKYKLNSPEAVAAGAVQDFTYMQRISTGNGTFKLELSVTDQNNPGAEAFTASREFAVDYPSDRVSISDIELLESFKPSTVPSRFTRNGVDMIPSASNFYSPGTSSLKFYAEIYRAGAVVGKDSDFILRYHLDGYESHKTAGNLGGLMKAKATDVNILLKEIPLADLPSGNYNLVVEAVNRQNTVLATRKTMIQHVSKVVVPLTQADVAEMHVEDSFVASMTADSLKQYIRYLYPIASPAETNAGDNLVKGNDLAAMQRHFYYFWLERDRLDPEGAWKEYKQRVDAVNASYGTPNSKGYQSDRGRVYLQYGPPSTIDESLDEPGAYPYMVWHYYVLGSQRNKRFVFMTKNRSSNDFELIHSDATGEIYNPNWMYQISDNQNSFGLGTEDKSRMPIGPDENSFGSRSKDTYQRPK